MRDPLRLLPLAVILLAAIIAAGSGAMAGTDQQAMPVGAIVLVLVALCALPALPRYLDSLIVLLGAGAYLLLERDRGGDGLVAWIVTVAAFIATLAAARLLTTTLAAAERQASQAAAATGEISLYDETSGLLKPHFGQLALEEEVRRSQHHGTPLTLVLIAAEALPENPLDDAHDIEESALLVGTLLREYLRPTDRSARLGPELFAAILPAIRAEGGVQVATKLMLGIRTMGDHPFRFGVASRTPGTLDGTDLLAEAQMALLFAARADLPIASPLLLAPEPTGPH